MVPSPGLSRRRVVDQCARIRGPSRVLVIGVVPRHLQRRATGEQADQNLAPPADQGHKRDHLPVGRHRRRLLHAREVREPLELDVAAGHRGPLRGTRIGSGLVTRVLELEACIANIVQSSSEILCQTSTQQSSGRRRAGRSAAAFQAGSASRYRSAIVSVPVSAANARCPLSISYTTQPNAQISARLSTPRPRTCSGAMYGTVPRTTPSPRHRAQ